MSVYAQKKKADEDTTISFTSFKNKIVLFGDLGFNTSPFSIHFKSAQTNIDKLRFRNNLPMVMGLGFSYKWLTLRLSFPIISNLRNKEKFGHTSYFGIGGDFPIKSMHFSIEYKRYNGYVIKNAYKWDPTIDKKYKNLYQLDVGTYSLSLESYFFKNKDFKFNNLRGKTGHYNKEVKTWYIKGHVDLQGVSNGADPIIPVPLGDSSNSKTFSTALSSFDFGAIPGYAYVNRLGNWQFAAMMAFGPVIQAKFYNYDGNSRGFLGLSPRYDVQMFGGYNHPKWFIMLHTVLDNKFILINDLKYFNFSYSIKLVGGYRFTTKKESKKNEKKDPI